MTHIVTEGLLQDNLNCQSKSYLRLHGQSGQVSDYSALCSRLDARHLASASQWLAAQSMIGGVSRFDGTRLEDKVTADAIVLDAVGATDGLETHFHAIERMPGDSQLGPFHYRPIRFCRSCNPVPPFIFSWRSTHLSLVAYRVSVLTSGFSFVAQRLGESAYSLGHTSIL
jgi:hypothetical protein